MIRWTAALLLTAAAARADQAGRRHPENTLHAQPAVTLRVGLSDADIMVSDDGFAATVFPVVSGYEIEQARVEHLAVDGNRAANPTTIDSCRTAGIYLSWER